MTLLQAIFLAITQGITEFLPVSSSGHLVFFQKLFKLTEPPVLFDVLLHFGTLLAILFFFKKELCALVIDWREHKKEWLFLSVGTLPAGFLGLFLNSKIKVIFDSLFLLGVSWLFFGLFILLTFRLVIKNDELKKKTQNLNWKNSLVIGFFQAVSLLPGVSRSGLTIIGCLWQKFSRETAFYLSFLLAIPAVLGATFLGLKDGGWGEVPLAASLVGIVISAIVGWLSLKLLESSLRKNRFYFFGFYCLAAGLLALFLSFHI